MFSLDFDSRRRLNCYLDQSVIRIAFERTSWMLGQKTGNDSYAGRPRCVMKRPNETLSDHVIGTDNGLFANRCEIDALIGEG